MQQAAKERHTSISQFVLESALNSASAVLAERSRFMLDAGQWEAFLTALDEPPRRHARMERLLNEPTYFSIREKILMSGIDIKK